MTVFGLLLFVETVMTTYTLTLNGLTKKVGLFKDNYFGSSNLVSNSFVSGL